MICDRLRHNLASVHEALREPEDFVLRRHLEGQPCSWSVFKALTLTAGTNRQGGAQVAQSLGQVNLVRVPGQPLG